MSEFSLHKDNLNKLIEISFKAGKVIMDIYKTDFDFEKKIDQSPLTAADLRSHEVILDSLSKLNPKIPIISEESSHITLSERSAWKEFWLIDPLDGTKEFIKKNGEFTINIALIRNNRPIFGIIHAPALNETYWGSKETGAHFLYGNIDSNSEQIMVSKTQDSNIRIVTSRSHPSSELQSVLKNLKKHSLIEIGSSLKFCKVAKGEADCYIRLGPTSEWDTAAGEAVVESAGATILDLMNSPIQYNKREGYLNPDFIVASNTILAKEIISAIQKVGTI